MALNQSRHNYFVPVLIGALALANICFHLARSSLIDIEPLRCLYAALMLIVLLETVIAGRVTPGFTASTIKGYASGVRSGLILPPSS